MGGGNGAKSKQARERNAAKAAAAGKKTVGGAKAAENEKCQFEVDGRKPCMTILMTTQRPDMKRHAAAHSGWEPEKLFPRSLGSS